MLQPIFWITEDTFLKSRIEIPSLYIFKVGENMKLAQ